MTVSRPARLGLAHERRDRVVRLEALALVDRDAQRLDDLADLRDLLPHVVRHPRPGALVLGVALVAEGRLGEVEGDRDPVRLRVLDRAQHDVREAEHGGHELALRGGEGLLDEGEVPAVDEPVAVEQEEAFHRLRACGWDPRSVPARPRQGTAGFGRASAGSRRAQPRSARRSSSSSVVSTNQICVPRFASPTNAPKELEVVAAGGSGPRTTSRRLVVHERLDDVTRDARPQVEERGVEALDRDDHGPGARPRTRRR